MERSVTPTTTGDMQCDRCGLWWTGSFMYLPNIDTLQTERLCMPCYLAERLEAEELSRQGAEK